MLRKSVELFNVYFAPSHVCTKRRRSVFIDGPLSSRFPTTSADITITGLAADLRSARLFSVEAFNPVKRLMGIERLVQDQLFI